jgi:hypothetical protein
VEIYFKKLTDDLLEVCRMLDDKPEIKTRLSEITVDVSFLPDVGYAFGKWTTTPPTEPGWYWVRNIKGKIWCDEVFKKDGVMCWWSEDENTFNSIILDYFTHWLGPLPPPEPPKE